MHVRGLPNIVVCEHESLEFFRSWCDCERLTRRLCAEVLFLSFPRHVSKFKSSVREETQRNKVGSKTMGPAKVAANDPQAFLKKHSKEPKLPESGSTTPCVHTCTHGVCCMNYVCPLEPSVMIRWAK